MATGCFGRLHPLVPGVQGVIYDTALRGAHHQVLLREHGLMPVNQVTAPWRVEQAFRPRSREEASASGRPPLMGTWHCPWTKWRRSLTRGGWPRLLRDSRRSLRTTPLTSQTNRGQAHHGFGEGVPENRLQGSQADAALT